MTVFGVIIDTPLYQNQYFCQNPCFFLLQGLSPGIPRQPQSHTHPYYSLKTLITYIEELYHYICWLVEVHGSVCESRAGYEHAMRAHVEISEKVLCPGK